MSSLTVVAARRVLRLAGHSLTYGLVLGVVSGCDSGRTVRQDSVRDAAPLELFTAGALAQPLRAAADSFAAATGAPAARLEAAGSLETVRKLTELHRIPDVVAVADAELIAELLMPELATWYVVVASDRMVLAYTERSRGADSISVSNWTQILSNGDVDVGRSDPDRDPAGYRALLAIQLAELQSASPGLADRLLERAPARLMRPKSADLVALLQAGEVDYGWLYASTARAAGLKMLELPGAVNLGDAAFAATYAAESVLVAGRARGEEMVIHGRRILFALTIPTGAPHTRRAVEFVAWLLDGDGQRILRAAGLELLPQTMIVGESVPPMLRRFSGSLLIDSPGST